MSKKCLWNPAKELDRLGLPEIRKRAGHIQPEPLKSG
jgi:hypothetical protein